MQNKTEYKGKRYKTAEQLGHVRQRQPPIITKMPPQEIGPFRPDVIQVPATTSGSHQDRARAFQIRTKHVSVAAAFFSIPIATIGFSVPLWGLHILGWISGSYFGVWFFSFILDTAASPDGIGLIRTLYEAGEVRAERKERHKYYERMYKE